VPQADRKEQRRAAAERRKELEPLRRKARDAERLVETLGRERSAVERALADPGTYGGNGDAASLLQRQAELARRLAAAEANWLAASEAVERAAAEWLPDGPPAQRRRRRSARRSSRRLRRQEGLLEDRPADAGEEAAGGLAERVAVTNAVRAQRCGRYASIQANSVRPVDARQADVADD